MDKAIQIKGKPWEGNRTNFDRNLAVVVGIDRYKNDSIRNLSTAVSDARAIADLLEQEYDYKLSKEKPEVIRLFNEQATLEVLRELFNTKIPEELKPGEGDRLVVYFAGHGLPRSNEDGPEGYLVPHDADPTDPTKFLAMREISEALSKLECHHLLVILDCCFAGTFRWAGSRKAVPILETIRREHYYHFIRHPAWQVITSSAHDQEALDVARLKEDNRQAVADRSDSLFASEHHSPFALALLEGLHPGDGSQRVKADLFPDGVVTAHELFVYLQTRVKQLSGDQQAPGIYPLRRDYDRGEFVFVRPDFNPLDPDPTKGLKNAPPLNEGNNPYRGLKSFDEKHSDFFFGRQLLIEELAQRLAQPDQALTVVLGVSGSGKSSLVKAGLIPYLRNQNTEQKKDLWRILDPMRPGELPFTSLARMLLPITNESLLEQVAQMSFLDKLFEPMLQARTEARQNSVSMAQDQQAQVDETLLKVADSWCSVTPEAKLLLIEDYFAQLEKLGTPQQQKQLKELHGQILAELDSVSQQLQQEPHYFSRAIATWSQNHPNVQLLLVMDQFEELLTRSQDDSAQRIPDGNRENPEQTELSKGDATEPKQWQKFLEVLRIAIVVHPQTLRLVLTLRSDFEPRFLSSVLEPYWKDARFPVRAMTSDELRQAIEHPALKQAIYFEELKDDRGNITGNLVSKLVDEVGQMPGALPLLSFTLSELYVGLYKRWQEDQSTDRTLRFADYEALGGVAGALTRRATQEYEALDAPHQATMRRVMLRMVTIEGGDLARRRVPTDELKYPSSTENARVTRVVECLINARLIVKGQEVDKANIGATVYVEPAHDFLIKGWDKLQEWIKEDQEYVALRQRLTPAAQDWKNKKGGLWTREEERLVQLEKIFASPEKNWLNELEIIFFRQSKESRFFELREAEKQRDEAIGGQISALNSLANVQFRTNDQLGSLVTSLKAGQKLSQAPPSVKDNISNQTIQNLQTMISDIQEYNRFQEHSGLIWDIAVHPNKELIASASYDKSIKLWHLDGNLANTLEGHTKDVVSICFNSNGSVLASAGYDKEVRLWRLTSATLERVTVLKNHSDKVTSVCFSPDDKLVASVGLDKIVNIWNIDSSISNSFEVNSWIWDVKFFNPDKQLIALACADNTIQFFSFNGRRVKVIRGHTDYVTSISFSSDGQILASASADKTIKLWSLDGKLLKTLEGHQNSVWRVEFSSDSQLLASSGWDNTVRIWSREGLLLQTLEGHTNRVWSARFLPGNRDLASCSADKMIKLWKIDSCLIKVFEGHKGWIWSVSFSPINQLIASASTDTTIRIWKYDGTLHQILEGHKDLVDSVCFTNDGRILASASADKTIKLWKLKAGKFRLSKTLDKHKERVRGLSFSSNGRLASAGFDKTVKLWDQDGVLLDSLGSDRGGHLAEVTSVCFSPDGNFLASASYDTTIKIWDRSGQLKTTLDRHEANVIALAFSPDSQLLVSASDDKTLMLWKVGVHEIVHLKTLWGHEGWVLGASFSRDGKLIASASADTTIKLWDVQTGYLLKTLKGHKDWVFGVGFEPSEGLLVSVSADRTIKWWNLAEIVPALDLDDLLSRGCKWIQNYLTTNPTLTDEERILCREVSTIL